MRETFVLGMFLLSASSAEEPVMGYNDMSNSQLDAMYSKDSSTQEKVPRSAGIQTAAPEAPPAVVNDVNAENAQLRAQVARLAAELARRPSSGTEEGEEDYFGEEGVDTEDSVEGGYDAAAKTVLTDDGRHAVVEKDANGEDQVVVYVQNTAEDATSKHATRLLEQADMYGGSELASKKGERKSSPLSIPGFGPENFAQEILETAPKKEKAVGQEGMILIEGFTGKMAVLNQRLQRRGSTQDGRAYYSGTSISPVSIDDDVHTRSYMFYEGNCGGNNRVPAGWIISYVEPDITLQDDLARASRDRGSDCSALAILVSASRRLPVGRRLWRVADGAGLATVSLVLTELNADGSPRVRTKNNKIARSKRGIVAQVYNLGIGVLDTVFGIVGLHVSSSSLAESPAPSSSSPVSSSIAPWSESDDLTAQADEAEPDEYGEIQGRAQIAHLYLQMSGLTGEVRVMNQLFRRAGYLLDGRAWYEGPDSPISVDGKVHPRSYIFYDADCGGSGKVPAGWIMSYIRPDPSLKRHLSKTHVIEQEGGDDLTEDDGQCPGLAIWINDAMVLKLGEQKWAVPNSNGDGRMTYHSVSFSRVGIREPRGNCDRPDRHPPLLCAEKYDPSKHHWAFGGNKPLHWAAVALMIRLYWQGLMLNPLWMAMFSNSRVARLR